MLSSYCFFVCLVIRTQLVFIIIVKISALVIIISCLFRLSRGLTFYEWLLFMLTIWLLYISLATDCHLIFFKWLLCYCLKCFKIIFYTFIFIYTLVPIIFIFIFVIRKSVVWTLDLLFFFYLFFVIFLLLSKWLWRFLICLIKWSI